ncbi:hypothetical protein MFM001_46660 [Mycobacterium sp. MFM001]|uniref:hypothetical protein n=1 Tax=Mycobacterium sp. MFM001 TaxID=2049453 RepID=UPI000DA4ABD0|nr:hypothetical protein [Mycobacterium sp. MFM001]GBE68204.1 hypothetical protein MFM001_46660 [Mycobacterium sp. MFM001]
MNLTAASQPDGTDADYFVVNLHYVGVTKAMMDRIGGVQILGSGRVNGIVFVWVLAYQEGRPNSNDGLLEDLSSALNDFSLTGTHL